MTVKDELELIRKSNGGLLDPEKVVEFAKDETTSLHSRFEWDDTEAARQYRVWQARQIIRVHVTVVGTADSEPVRAYVSLEPDRGKGGYRAIDDVLSDEDMRSQLLSQARRDMNVFAAKYRALKEIRPVIDAIEAFNTPQREPELQSA